MTESTNTQATIVRTSRGLSIAGTRITLYQVMDYVKAGWPPELIQHWLDLSEKQITDAINYIATHRSEVETEYEMVLQQAEESRQYWEARNRECFATLATTTPKPGQEVIRAKLQAWKTKLGMK
jgi:uncharacterized protein (DUF433 family)